MSHPAFLRTCIDERASITPLFDTRYASVTMSTSRHVCFTLNNPEHDDDHYRDILDADDRVRYCVFRREKGANGTIHLQGYIEWKKTVRFAALFKLIGNCHAEKRQGNRDQARAYCISTDKEGECVAAPVEIGTWNTKGHGNRSDLNTIAQLAIDSNDINEVINSNPGCFMRYCRGIERIMFFTQKQRSEPAKIILHYGPTGTGKTYSAYVNYPDLCKKVPDTRWFDGLTNQSTLLLDDFAGAASKTTLTYLLQLLDRYPFMVEVKGGYQQLLVSTIILTTNIHPSIWYDYTRRETQYAALARRFHEVWFFHTMDEEPYFLDKDVFFNEWHEGCNEMGVFTSVTRPNTPLGSDDEDEDFQWEITKVTQAIQSDELSGYLTPI